MELAPEGEENLPALAGSGPIILPQWSSPRRAGRTPRHLSPAGSPRPGRNGARPGGRGEQAPVRTTTARRTAAMELAPEDGENGVGEAACLPRRVAAMELAPEGEENLAALP